MPIDPYIHPILFLLSPPFTGNAKGKGDGRPGRCVRIDAIDTGDIIVQHVSELVLFIPCLSLSIDEIEEVGAQGKSACGTALVQSQKEIRRACAGLTTGI